MNIGKILEIINIENGRIYKTNTIKALKDTEDWKLFQKVVQMALDKVKYSYGLTPKYLNFKKNPREIDGIPLYQALKALEDLNDRVYTGNDAKEYITQILEALSGDDQEVIIKILSRDLRINYGRSLFNKLLDKEYAIKKPPYCRCKNYSEDEIINGKVKKGTINKITFPAKWQKKEDGTYRTVELDSLTFLSRSGEEYYYPKLKEKLSHLSELGYNGVIIGEMTVRLTKELLEMIKVSSDDYDFLEDKLKENKEYILPRKMGNGLLNSDNLSEDNIIFTVWDYVSQEDYIIASIGDKNNIPKDRYIKRFGLLNRIVENVNYSNLRVIDSQVVHSKEEAMELTSKVMKDGFEGGILKDLGMLFRNHTSPHQLKMKISFDLEVRVIGFIEGKENTKRADTFGSILYGTDDDTIKGSVSGFSDKELKEINDNRSDYIGKIMTIEGNDLTISINGTHHSVSHPRFIEFRNDKTNTDTLPEALEKLESAKNFK